MRRMLIIGGSDAGISAALRIRELDAAAEISVVVADAYPAFSICGLPFLLSGEIADWRSLAHHGVEEFEKQGIKLLLNHQAEAIMPQAKSVRVSDGAGQSLELGYDKLLVATGAEAARPPVGGIGQSDVFLLRWMSDGLAILRYLEREKPRRAVIIGAGYIGLEMADALTRRGLAVTVLEFLPEVLATFDSVLGRLVRAELERRDIKVLTGRAVRDIERENESLLIRTGSGESHAADMVLVATGVKPSTALAETAGITTGAGGAIRVDRTMSTVLPDILAAGDCAETWHHILRDNIYMPLGTTAHKQGRVAGENMAGGCCEFQGSLGTQAVKVFGLVAAATGLRYAQAAKAGFNPLSVMLTTTDRNAYYPGATDVAIIMTGDRHSGRLLGVQIVGRREAEISKRIDVIAAALFAGMAVADLPGIDLSYSPPLSSPWDPLQKAAMLWEKERRRSSGS